MKAVILATLQFGWLCSIPLIAASVSSHCCSFLQELNGLVDSQDGFNGEENRHSGELNSS